MKSSFGKATFSGTVIAVYLLAMYIIGSITSLMVSWTVPIILLIIACVLLFLARGANSTLSLSKTASVWIILSVLCFIGVIRGIASDVTVFAFYVLCLFLILMCWKISVDRLYNSLNWIRIFGLFFSAGCYWQYLFPDRYFNILYPLFGAKYQDSIRRQFTSNKMCTGFTSQTAITAQFIILGIMAVLYMYSTRKTKTGKIISVIELVFLAGGLLLTGKRSPIINLSAAIIVVSLLTVKRGKRGNRILAIAFGIIIALTALYLLAPFFSGSRNSLLRMLEYTDIEEASNGRFSLYRFAISEFLKHPILGIGWGKYSILYDTTGAHNIYLQLLCECGLIGFVPAVGGMLVSLIQTIKMLKKETLDMDASTKIILKCSVFIQVYIMVYGIFGNPIYDQNYILMYCLGIMMATVVGFERVNKSS